MRNLRVVLLLLLGGASAGRGENIHIEKVVGEAWYSATAESIPVRVKAGTDLPLGFLRTDLNGVIYGSPITGSKFRLAGGTSVQIESNNQAVKIGADGMEQDAVIRLSRGKITMTVGNQGGRYDVLAQGGKVTAGSGLCVVCSSSDAAHVYPARGMVILYPHLGAYRRKGVRLMAGSMIAVLKNDGTLQIEPLMQAAPSTHNCLLSGASPSGGGALESGLPNPANLRQNFPVSEDR